MENIINTDRKRDESLIDLDEVAEQPGRIQELDMMAPSVSVPFSAQAVSIPPIPEHGHDDGGADYSQSEEGGEEEGDDESGDASESYASSAPSSRPRKHHRHHHSRKHRHHRHSRPKAPIDHHKAAFDNDIRESANNFTKFKNESNAYAVSEHDEKLELLARIQQFQNEGIPCLKKVTAYSPLDELRYTLYQMSREYDRNKSVSWFSQSLVTGIRMLEFANKRFDPFGIRLEGFSRNVALNLDDYKPALLGIHARYGSTRMQSSNPIFQLLFTLAGALLFHHVSVIAKEEEQAERPLTSVGKVITSLAGKNIQKSNPFASTMVGPPSDIDDSDSE